MATPVGPLVAPTFTVIAMTAQLTFRSADKADTATLTGLYDGG
ncbi:MULTISPECIES: hypothetical protein [unclassified Streptomyces]|nr:MULTISPECIES: hypothetical protein [unclassified Streptomyces]WPO74207.1 hypothetical protein R9806_28135 [Streptomyces sp. KN37]